MITRALEMLHSGCNFSSILWHRLRAIPAAVILHASGARKAECPAWCPCRGGIA